MPGTPRHVPLLLGIAAALALAGLTGVALAPTLLVYHPLWLVALSPIGRHLVLAATLVPMLPLVLVATARRMLSSSVGYGLGRAYGAYGLQQVRDRYPRLQRAIGVLERMFERAAPLVVFFAPAPVFCAMAGATSMSLGVFVPVAVAGHLMWASLTYRLGEALGSSIVPLLGFVREHVVSTTLACALLALGYALLRRRARRKRARQAAHASAPPPIAWQPPPGEG